MQSENNNKKRDIFTVLLGQFELRFIEREFGDYYRAKFGGILTSHAEISRLLTNTENEIGTGIFENASEFVIIGPDEREETFNSFTLKGCKTAREYGLAILSRANLVRRYYGFEELTWVEKPESPSSDPAVVLSEFIATLEQIDLQPFQDAVALMVEQYAESVRLARAAVSQILDAVATSDD